MYTNAQFSDIHQIALGKLIENYWTVMDILQGTNINF